MLNSPFYLSYYPPSYLGYGKNIQMFESSLFNFNENISILEPLTIGNRVIHFILTKDNEPALRCDRNYIFSIYEALNSLLLPLYSDPKTLNDLALIINFLSSKNEYQCINKNEEIEAFKAHYKAAIQREQEDPNELPILSRHGIFNIEEIQPPYFSNQDFIFYVQKNDIPYRVVVQNFNDKQPSVHYQLLNFIKNLVDRTF